MEVETQTGASLAVADDLVEALEQAAPMAKQLPTANPYLQRINISPFSSPANPSPPLPHNLMEACIPSSQPESSISSAVGSGGNENGKTDGGEGEPMRMGADEDEHNTIRGLPSVELQSKVEKRMESFIQNKRPKRQLSPSTATAGDMRKWLIRAVLGHQS